MAERGTPKVVVSDNGTELTSNAILAWADTRRMALHRVGQAHAERLHRKFQRELRDEFLNETLFTSLAQARAASSTPAERVRSTAI